MLRLAVALTIISAIYAQKNEEKPAEQPKQQIIYVAALPEGNYEPQPRRYPDPAELNYLGLLEQQYQIPGGYNFIPPNKQPFTRVQPQILYYGPGGQGGQPFLLSPVGPPPGNFLVPQQPQPAGPPLIYRDQQPQRPVFVAGYPKPAHIPPVEKDAEEVPTNPERVAPLKPNTQGTRPEKLETFNEDRRTMPAEPREPSKGTLKPGQRFFVLNGQPLFLNYPFAPYQETEKAVSPVPLPLLVRNLPNFESQPQFAPQIQAASREAPQSDLHFRLAEQPISYFQYQNDDLENDAIIIDAKFQDEDDSKPAAENDSEAIATPAEKQVEPSISQAQPGAIALAGPGGVAGAAPRGTALVGKGGLAVSSPQATAVAGPSKTEPEKTKKSNKSERED